LPSAPQTGSHSVMHTQSGLGAALGDAEPLLLPLLLPLPGSKSIGRVLGAAGVVVVVVVGFVLVVVEGLALAAGFGPAGLGEPGQGPGV